jgi:predicted transcriptional regulator with HTH domain
MSRSRIVFALVACAMALSLGASDVLAQETKPIQLSLFDPVQIFKADQSIKGLRLNIIYSNNVDVTGLDIGLLVNRATGDFKGIQFGLVNIDDGDATGWVAGAVNVTEGQFTGLQGSGNLFNQAGGSHGAQFGWINRTTGKMSGLQLGLVNIAESADGLQIGLINLINTGAKFKFFPIVNWSFD